MKVASVVIIAMIGLFALACDKKSTAQPKPSAPKTIAAKKVTTDQASLEDPILQLIPPSFILKDVSNSLGSTIRYTFTASMPLKEAQDLLSKNMKKHGFQLEAGQSEKDVNKVLIWGKGGIFLIGIFTDRKGKDLSIMLTKVNKKEAQNRI